VFSHLALNVGVPQHRLPDFRQGEAHPQNQGTVFETERLGRVQRGAACMFEYRVSVTEGALRGVQGKNLPGLQIDGIQRIKPVLQLDTVRAHVLHRRGAHGAGNQGHVFHAGQVVVQRPGHKVVPAFAGTGFHDDGLGGFPHHPDTAHLHFEYQGLHIARQHNVAATTQYKLGLLAPRRIGQQRTDILLPGDVGQRGRLGHDAEGVKRLQGNVFLD